MKGAIAFEAPESMEVDMELPHRGKIKGMGIPEGITLIVGGGYHGKSTLLKALEQGIYNHVAGDGREYVITSDTAMKIRAEDGRCVSHINISPENLLKLNLLLNTTLTGLTLQEMHLGLISKMESQAGEHMGIVKEVLDAIVETISKADDLKIYTSGATNIFKYPELSDSGKASELIYALEEKQGLSGLVNDKEDTDEAEDDNHGIQVYIGNETPVESMKDCSVVTATYELQDGMKGTIGIIGPKRMDYEKVVDTLKEMQTHLDDVFKKT